MKKNIFLLLNIIVQLHASDVSKKYCQQDDLQSYLNENLYSSMYFYAERADSIVNLIGAGADPGYG